MATTLWQQLGLPKPKSEASKGTLSLVDNEVYSGIEVPDMPFFVRLDGWSFHALSQKIRLKKPFDRWFASALAKIAAQFFLPFNPRFAYIFSDEINFLFVENPTFRRVEKIDSVFAGLASSIFGNLLKEKYKKTFNVVFDCRCIPLAKADIVKYLIWRQAEAFRNSNNSYAQHILIKRGLSARAAAKKLDGMRTAELRALIDKAVGLKRIPAWHERGIGIYKEAYKKKGYDPIKKKAVTVLRYRPKVEWKLPIFATNVGKKFIAKLTK